MEKIASFVSSPPLLLPSPSPPFYPSSGYLVLWMTSSSNRRLQGHPHPSQDASSMSSSSVLDTDLAFAELELLNQNQRKLQNLTSRMTTILSGFDKRLGKLESSILPIHKSTQRLLRVGESE